MDAFSDQTRTCTECGKEFLMLSGDLVYRSGKGKGARLFCSWHCIQAWRKEKPRKVERRFRVIYELQDHPDTDYLEIARRLGEEPKYVWYWKQKQEKGEI